MFVNKKYCNIFVNLLVYCCEYKQKIKFKPSKFSLRNVKITKYYSLIFL